MTIFCTSCRGPRSASKQLQTVGGTGARQWHNVCHTCRTSHPAPPPDQAARNQRQRATVRRRQYLERRGQQTLFKGGES